MLPDFAGVQPSPTSLRETPVTDSHGRSSLHIAMRGGYGPIIETMHALKWHDLDINSKIGLYGETPLAVAALFNKSEASSKGGSRSIH